MTAPDPRLGEIEGRLEKVTPGPIELTRYPDEGGRLSNDNRQVIADIYSAGDTAFYANARSDVAYLLAELRKAQDKLDAMEKVRQELFELSNDDGWTTETRAAYRDASRAIYTTLRAAVAAATGGGECG